MRNDPPGYQHVTGYSARTRAAKPKPPKIKPHIVGPGIPPPGLTTPVRPLTAPMTPTVPPAAGGPPPLPPDPWYDQQIGRVDRDYGRTVSDYEQQRTKFLYEEGYTRDAAGALAIDPTNPYSRQRLAKEHFDRSRRIQGNEFAARGQLYSGANQGMQDYVTHQEAIDQNTRDRMIGDFLGGIDAGIAAAGTAAEDAKADAGFQRVDRIAQNPLWSPPPPVEPPPGPPTLPQLGTLGAAPSAAEERIVVKPSAAHGGKKWRYRVRASDGKLIPLGPA